MDVWSDTLGIGFTPYLLLVVGSGALSMFYLSRTLQHVREEKRWVIFVPPAWFFCRDCFDDQGNLYRVRAMWTTALFFVIVLLGWLAVYHG